jgi:hypothetical protein
VIATVAGEAEGGRLAGAGGDRRPRRLPAHRRRRERRLHPAGHHRCGDGRRRLGEERYGITPAQYVDYAALRGDNSDNLPGVPGVGEKTAAKLISSYGNLEGIYDHLDEQTPKLRENLEANRDQVFLNRKLMTTGARPRSGRRAGGVGAGGVGQVEGPGPLHQPGVPLVVGGPARGAAGGGREAEVLETEGGWRPTPTWRGGGRSMRSSVTGTTRVGRRVWRCGSTGAVLIPATGSTAARTGWRIRTSRRCSTTASG